MERVLCLVLAVALVAAGLAPRCYRVRRQLEVERRQDPAHPSRWYTSRLEDSVFAGRHLP